MFVEGFAILERSRADLQSCELQFVMNRILEFSIYFIRIDFLFCISRLNEVQRKKINKVTNDFHCNAMPAIDCNIVIESDRKTCTV